MTPEAVSSPQPEPARMGAGARIAGVFFEPGKTFADIGQKPTWIVPVVLLMIATCAVMWVMGHRIGWEQIARQAIESNPRTAQMPAEQREAAIAMQAKFSGMSIFFIPILMPVYYLLVSAIMLGFTAMMSAGLRFKQVFAVVCHANLPGLISAALTIVVIYLKNPTEFNPQNALAFNPAAFMDPASSSKFLYSLASSLDLFSFWIIFLLATGFSAASARRLSFGKALTAAVLPWAIYVLGKSAIAGAFS